MIRVKRQLIICLALIMPIISLAQVNITLVVPDELDELDSHSFNVLKNRLEQMMSHCGVQSSYDANIVMYPVVTIMEKEVIGGSMEKLFRYNIELTLHVVQPEVNTNFGSTSWNLYGDGFSASKALVSAINRLNRNDQKFIHFVEQIKHKVVNYYVSNRSALISKAKTLASQGQYEEAMGILSAYPQGVAGSAEVDAELLKIYKRYSTANCSQMINQARALYAKQDYDQALAILGDVDATSSCASEAKALETQIGSRIVSEQRREEARQERAEQREYNLEKARLSAARDIAVAYYKRRQPKITYNSIYIRNNNFY